jgi:hypothetical protein
MNITDAMTLAFIIPIWSFGFMCGYVYRYFYHNVWGNK